MPKHTRKKVQLSFVTGSELELTVGLRVVVDGWCLIDAWFCKQKQKPNNNHPSSHDKTQTSIHPIHHTFIQSTAQPLAVIIQSVGTRALGAGACTRNDLIRLPAREPPLLHYPDPPLWNGTFTALNFISLIKFSLRGTMITASGWGCK